MTDLRRRRLRLALPFTVVAEEGHVLLVAGEDHRYALRGAGIEQWLPALLERIDGKRTVGEAVEPLASAARALETLERLLGERVLVESSAEAARTPRRARLVLEGQGPIRDALERENASGDAEVLVFCQDRLDPAAALAWNGRLRAGESPGIWVTCGPGSRGYVSPLFLPDTGPCLACLQATFERLSPAPEVWRALERHGRDGGRFEPASFPSRGVRILAELVLWKLDLLADPDPPSALYRLHVVETATLETSSHRVFRDPGCSACGAAP
ncbi:MAG TPA: TOMM precursor leader peptide-binding protein [Planctomycetota bacterium]|nr:TOMM precursor leader peptide-binding protein [Planctomycetota bacterium]